MNLHLVGGFLGSGKTTAIIGAAKALMAKGKKVSVITNDQGRYLVDTAFFKLGDIPTVEVTGGCFCCNYDDLDERLDQLKNSIQPDVIFAESVGSCGDLVATVIKPLLQLRKDSTRASSFSVFVDGRLLLMRLAGEDLPFSDNVIYIFDKQIEETKFLIINKADLMTTPEKDALLKLVHASFPDKVIHLQNSLNQTDVDGWVDSIESGNASIPDQSINMDYQRYGEGEAALAWLDQEIQVTFPDGNSHEKIVKLISAIAGSIQEHHIAIGHLKFFVKSEENETKISFPTLNDDSWKYSLPHFHGTQFTILINARVETQVEQMQRLLNNVLDNFSAQTGAKILSKTIDFFHPKQPNPTHRIA